MVSEDESWVCGWGLVVGGWCGWMCRKVVVTENESTDWEMISKRMRDHGIVLDETIIFNWSL